MEQNKRNHSIDFALKMFGKCCGTVFTSDVEKYNKNKIFVLYPFSVKSSTKLLLTIHIHATEHSQVRGSNNS